MELVEILFSDVYTLFSSIADRNRDHRMQKRNSTTKLLVHLKNKPCQIN